MSLIWRDSLLRSHLKKILSLEVEVGAMGVTSVEEAAGVMAMVEMATEVKERTTIKTR